SFDVECKPIALRTRWRHAIVKFRRYWFFRRVTVRLSRLSVKLQYCGPSRSQRTAGTNFLLVASDDASLPRLAVHAAGGEISRRNRLGKIYTYLRFRRADRLRKLKETPTA